MALGENHHKIMASTFYSIFLTFIAIAKCQTFEDCGSTTIYAGNSYVGNVSLTLQLQRDTINEMVRITLTGRYDVWWGFVLGQGTMDGGYGVYWRSQYNSVSQTYKNLFIEQALVANSGQTGGGTQLESSGTYTITKDIETTNITFVRPWTMSDSSYYDFANLLGTCSTNTIDTMSFAAAGGYHDAAAGFTKHRWTLSRQTFTRTCMCPTGAPTTSNPTNQPTTADPTLQPSIDPTNEPTTVRPTTARGTEFTQDQVSSGNRHRWLNCFNIIGIVLVTVQIMLLL